MNSPRESAEDCTLRQRRGESSQDHGDQAGRDGGTKKQTRKKTKPTTTFSRMRTNAGITSRFRADSEAAERSSPRTANGLRRFDEGRTVGVEIRSSEPIQPRPRRPPFIFKPLGVFPGSTGTFFRFSGFSSDLFDFLTFFSFLGA